MLDAEFEEDLIEDLLWEEENEYFESLKEEGTNKLRSDLTDEELSYTFVRALSTNWDESYIYDVICHENSANKTLHAVLLEEIDWVLLLVLNNSDNLSALVTSEVARDVLESGWGNRQSLNCR